MADIPVLSTSNTFLQWLNATNQLTLQQGYFNTSIDNLNENANNTNRIVIGQTVAAGPHYLVTANVVTGNATNVFASVAAYYSPATGILTVPAAAFSGNSSIVLPKGSTAQRPTANAGMIRYNTSKAKVEGYVANVWDSVVFSRDVGLANTANLSYTNDEFERIYFVSEKLLSGETQNTNYIYDLANERIDQEIVTIGTKTTVTTYAYNVSTNVCESWSTVES